MTVNLYVAMFKNVLNNYRDQKTVLNNSFDPGGRQRTYFRTFLVKENILNNYRDH